MEFLKNIYHIEYSGHGLVLATFMIDWFVLVLSKTLFRLYKHFKTREIVKIKKQLKDIDMKNEFAKYARLNRKLKEISKTNDVKDPSRIWSYIRIFLPILIFRNCWICEVDADFWSPIQRMVSFPHKLVDNKLKIGFVFFWSVARTIDTQLFSYVYP